MLKMDGWVGDEVEAVVEAPTRGDFSCVRMQFLVVQFQH